MDAVENGAGGNQNDVEHSPRSAAAVFVWLALASFFAIKFGLEAFDELTKLTEAPEGEPYTAKINSFWFDFSPTHSQTSVLVGAAGGLIGALSFSAWAAAVHFANENFGKLWVPWYFVRVFLGGVLGGAIVLAISAGLVTGGPDEVSPAGAAVMGFIVGLAAKKTMDKFEELVDVLFGRDAEPAADSLTTKVREIRDLAEQDMITTAQAEARIADLLAE